MANPARGSVALPVGDKTYTLSFSVNSLCELEDHMDQPVAKMAAGMDNPENVRLTTVRALIWAGLLDHHPEIKDMEDEGRRFAGDLASEAGVPAVMDAVGKAFALAFPDAPEAGGSARPRKAANG